MVYIKRFCLQIKDWFDTEGEARLLDAESVDDCSERIQQTLQSFKAFLSEANVSQSEENAWCATT